MEGQEEEEEVGCESPASVIKNLRSPFALTVALAAALVAPASGLGYAYVQTLGETPPPGGTPQACSANTTYVQSQADPDSDWDFPGGYDRYVITQWSVQAGSAGGTVALQLIAAMPAFSHYVRPVAESAVETLTPSKLNTFDTRITSPEDAKLALRVVSGAPACSYSGFVSGFELREASPSPAVGSAAMLWGNPQEGVRLNVEAVIESDGDEDGFGDDSQDGCPKDPARQDDCVKPTVIMTGGPVLPLRTRKAKFVLSSDEPDATFEYNLDETKFKPCKSHLTLKHLKSKKHHLMVRAVDANGNLSAIHTFQWITPKHP